MLIGQAIGLPFIMPLAINLLQDSVLAEGDLHEGDLLISVLRANEYWVDNPTAKDLMKQLLRSKHDEVESLEEGSVKQGILRTIDDFENK